jgi:hypothetical protein
MSRWFRLYDDVVTDPKVQRLSGDKFKTWINMLCLCSKNGGVLPSISEMSFTLRISEKRLESIIDEFLTAQLLDKIEVTQGVAAFRPHNWNGRQFKSDVSSPRVKRFRERQRNVSGNVSSNGSETPPDTESESESESEKKKTRASALADGWPKDFKDQFWAKYPNKVGKPKALAKLEACMRRGVPWAAIITGIENYIRTKPPDRAWLNPETFINQERWNDQPALATDRPAAARDPSGRVSPESSPWDSGL